MRKSTTAFALLMFPMLLAMATGSVSFSQPIDGEKPPVAIPPGDADGAPDSVTPPGDDAPVGEESGQGDGGTNTGEATPDESAGTAPAPEEPKPWNEGITEQDIAAAKPFFDRGNDFFKRSMYAKALVEYRQAIQHRDHPAIRFNMAVCLMNSQQEVEAFEELTKAMRFGETPLGAKLYQDGKTYRNLLKSQLATIRIVTEEVGANIALDGEVLFVGPGEMIRLVKPVSHLIVASKEGMRTLTKELTPTAGGEMNLVALEMITIADSVVMRRRWKTWKPWAVTGGGVAAAALGVPFYLFARSNAKDYDDQTIDICPSMAGCRDDGTPLPRAVKDLRSRAETQQVVAFSLFAIGGAVAVAGATMFYINRPRPTEPDDAVPGAAGETTFSLEPMMSAETQGLSAVWRGTF